MSFEITFTDRVQVELVQHVGDDAMIAAAAWVSTSGEAARLQLANSEVTRLPGLINYLMKHRHGTPFEHGSMTFYAHAPIFVWREWMRHRIGHSFNEESGRYSELKPVFYIPGSNRNIIPVENYKPARPEFRPARSLEEYIMFTQMLKSQYTSAFQTYKQMLDKGFAKEISRIVLPVGIFSSGWVTVNPRSLMSFLSLRTHEAEASFVSYPQYEIEVAARQMELAFSKLYPETYAAFVKNGRVAP